MLGRVSAAAVFFAAALLSACGGTADKARGPDEQVIHDQIGQIGKRADLIVSTDLIVTSTPVPLPSDRLPVVCEGDSCTAFVPTGPLPYNTVAATTFNSEEQESKQVGTRYGVRIRETTGSDEALGQIDFRGLGGWLEHSVFSSDRSTFVGGVRWIGAGAAGLSSGTNPAAGALTWRGAMTGLDKLADEEPLIGDAAITFDVGRQTLDLALTNILTFDTGQRHDNFSWSGVPVTGGRFNQGAAGDSLSGSFFGSAHEEVSGVFERRNIVGSFGAKRQKETGN